MSAFNSMVSPGSGDPLQEAIARRQNIGGAASGTVSPGSPTFDPNAQAPQIPQSNPMASMPPVPPQSAPPTPQGLGSAPMDQGNPNTKIILGAMKEYLGHIAKMESTQVGAPYGK